MLLFFHEKEKPPYKKKLVTKTHILLLNQKLVGIWDKFSHRHLTLEAYSENNFF